MRGIGQGQGESFARYYLRQIALGEGCNCAEALVGREVALSRPEAGEGASRGVGGLDRPRKGSMVARIKALFRRKPAAP